MINSYGNNYMKHFEYFDKKPFAAASIGQVHYGRLKNNNNEVAIKIQYPGVSESIQSDIDNLMMLLNVSNVLPKSLYAENVINVMKKELLDECNYIREANCSNKFSELLKNDNVFIVPKIYNELTTENILVSELVYGEPFDKCFNLSQDHMNHVIFI